MLVRASEKSWEWSVGAIAALALTAVQISLAMLAIAQPALQTLPIVLLLIALTIADAILVAYASLPIEAKIVLIAAIGTALIGTVIVHGALRQQMAAMPMITPADERVDPDATAPAPPTPKVAGLAITTNGEAAAVGFGSDVNRLVAASDTEAPTPPEVTATIEVENDAGGTVYRIVWSLRRGADRRWCGQSIARYVSREAAAQAFASMIATARAIPATEGLRCE